MERRYVVNIEYMNGRENSLIVWAETPEQAIDRACKGWGYKEPKGWRPLYKKLYAEDINY
ncbi:MAG: hypothetical protein K5637_01760 [Lachnospiraceae bacterium]|nr:hypothetical protein [Lachnospiraceae bacterium]